MPRPNQDKTNERNAKLAATDEKLDKMGGKDLNAAVDAAKDLTELGLVVHRVDVDKG